MEHIDEIIVHLRNREEGKRLNERKDLNEGAIIYSTHYAFTSQSFFDDTFSISLPEAFREMDDAVADRKYPARNRPPVIWTNESNQVHFTFRLMEGSLSEQELPVCRTRIKEGIRQVYPATIFYNDGLIEGADCAIELFDFKSFSMEGAVYNIMYLAVIGGYGLLGTFQCPFRYFEEWQPVVYKILGSLQAVKKEE